MGRAYGTSEGYFFCPRVETRDYRIFDVPDDTFKWWGLFYCPLVETNSNTITRACRHFLEITKMILKLKS